MKFFRGWWAKRDDGTELPETLMTLLRTQAETWTSLEPIGNTLPASWETTAQSAPPAWWAQRRAAAKPSVTEHNVSIMMFYWFLFLNKWKIIHVIHQQQSVIKGLIITEHVSIVRSQSWKLQCSRETRRLLILCPSRDTGGHRGGTGVQV